MTVDGLFSLTAIETPLISPPPEAPTSTMSGMAPIGLGLLHHLEAGRALAGDDVDIVEGMHVERRAALAHSSRAMASRSSLTRS